MKSSLCITTYNKPIQLKQVLAGIRSMTVLPSEVLVCDDGSGPDTRSMIEGLQAGFPVPLRHLWQPDEGWQVSKARNMGIREASGDYIIFIDGDCIPHRNFLCDHLHLAAHNHIVLGDRVHIMEAYTGRFRPDLTNVIPGILFKRMRKRYYAIRNPLESPRTYALKDVTALELANLALGCNMGFWKADIERINGFNEDLEGWALEDIEMTARLLVSGVVAKKVRRKAILYHLDHGEPVYDGVTILDATKAALEGKGTWTASGLKREKTALS